MEGLLSTGPTPSSLFTAQKPFVSLLEAPKPTLCSLMTSDLLDIASNSMLTTSLHKEKVAGTLKLDGVALLITDPPPNSFITFFSQTM